MSKIIKTAVLGVSLMTTQAKEKDIKITENTVSETRKEVSSIFNFKKNKFSAVSPYHNPNIKKECRFHNITNIKSTDIGNISLENNQSSKEIGALNISQTQKDYETFLNPNIDIEKKDGDLVIKYDCKNYDLTRFKNKVLEPIEYLLAKKGENIDILNLLKIAMTENSGSTHSSEVKHVLNLLTDDNYLSKLNTKSHKGAKGLFQVMPKTANYLDKLFDIGNLITKEKAKLKEIFDISKKDFIILENALYAAFYLKHSEDYLNKKGNNITDEKLAKIYNGGPKALRRMASETKKYVKKFNNAGKILEDNEITYIGKKWENIVAIVKEKYKKVFKS